MEEKKVKEQTMDDLISASLAFLMQRNLGVGLPYVLMTTTTTLTWSINLSL